MDGAMHGRALDDLLAQDSKRVSLVDAASFVVMRHQKIEHLRSMAISRRRVSRRWANVHAPGTLPA